MPLPIPQQSLVRSSLSQEEEAPAKLLSLETRAKLETMNIELAEAIAEFTFQGGGDSGVLLNTPDYWQLRGRRGLIIELLEADAEAKGMASPQDGTQEDNSSNQFPSQPQF